MPVMPRIKGKALKIAWKLLGKPDNMKKRSKKQIELDKRFKHEETGFIRGA